MIYIIGQLTLEILFFFFFFAPPPPPLSLSLSLSARFPFLCLSAFRRPVFHHGFFFFFKVWRLRQAWEKLAFYENHRGAIVLCIRYRLSHALRFFATAEALQVFFASMFPPHSLPFHRPVFPWDILFKDFRYTWEYPLKIRNQYLSVNVRSNLCYAAIQCLHLYLLY